MAEFWKRDSGGTPQKAREVWLRDSGGVARKAREIWMRDAGGVARRVFVGAQVVANSGTLKGVGTADVPPTATVQFNTNGTIACVASPTDASGARSVVWLSATDTGNGSSFWLRATVVSGALTDGTPGVWLSGSTARAFGVTAMNPSAHPLCTISVDFSMDSAGAQIVSSGNTWSLEAAPGP